VNPILITLTGPTCSGKTTILNSLVNDLGVRQLVSTTTRGPRLGEVEGRDYYFISEAQSQALEAKGQFAELVTFNGVRYGVTHAEMKRGLSQGLMTIILEPNGVHQYEELGNQLGFRLFRVFVDSPLEVRVERLKGRLLKDLQAPVAQADIEQVSRAVNTYAKRLVIALTEELTWSTAHRWDLSLQGAGEPVAQAKIILEAVHQ